MLLDLLTAFEASALGAAIRGANVWTYGVLNLLHVLGLSTLFGAIAVLDLRLLGLWRIIPVKQLARPVEPVAASGFVLAVISGICMLSVNATSYYGNPFMFAIKFPALALALINIAVLHQLPAWKAEMNGQATARQHRTLAISGGLSLLLWLTVISAGRLIGYW